MLLGAACAWSDPKHWRDTVPKEIVKKNAQVLIHDC
jgi:hypothetical protein